MCILINCFNAKLSLFRETLPVAMTVRFTASAVIMWPICYGDTCFNFRPLEIQPIVRQVIAYGRLKIIGNFKQSSLKWSLTKGGRL